MLLVLLPAATPAPPLDPQRPLQALYHIEAQAAQSGWTAELAFTAGDIWESMGDLVRAVSYWELAETYQAPLNANRQRRLAQAYLELYRWSQAVISLSRLADHTDDNWAHFQLGVLQSVYDPRIAAGQFVRAARDPQYQGVVTALQVPLSEPPSLGQSMRVGTLLATYNYWAEAEYIFTVVASTPPVLPDALAYAAVARDQQGKDGALQMEQAVNLAPQNAQVRYLQGIHLRMTGDSEGSLAALKLSVMLDPLNPAYAAEMAAAYERLGDAITAEYWYKAAVTLSNNDPRYAALLTTFYSQPSLTIVTATPIPALPGSAP